MKILKLYSCLHSNKKIKEGEKTVILYAPSRKLQVIL